jgi:ABC-type spermidine/putrescine transport system permease subunit II
MFSKRNFQCRPTRQPSNSCSAAIPRLFAIVRLSLYVSLSAVVLAALIGIPLGAWIALTKFPGRQGVIVLLNRLMGLPPVVVGLAVYPAAVALRTARRVRPVVHGRAP